MVGPKQKRKSITTPGFYDLKTSTKTVMVYTNLWFNLGALLTELPTCPVRLPANRKAKKTDIWGPYGGLITVQNGKTVRGVDIRKAKKAVATKPGANTKSVDYFLNQISVLMSLTGGVPAQGTPPLVKTPASITRRKTNYNIHMMWFNSSIKIAGCGSDDDAVLAINMLFDWYIKPLQLAGKVTGKSYYTITGGDVEPRFVFDTAMKNVDFSLGLDLDREQVNNLLNRKTKSTSRVLDKVFLAQFETTEQKSVNMKMFAQKPAGFTWTQYLPEDANKLSQTTELMHTESREQLYSSFLIFFSGKVIMSGKYDEDMRQSFEGFVQLMRENEALVEDTLLEVTEQEKCEFRALLDQANGYAE
jgi:hypothetical protein